MTIANRMQLIKEFLNKDAKPISMQEFGEFWKSLSEEEKNEYAIQSAKLLEKTVE